MTIQSGHALLLSGASGYFWLAQSLWTDTVTFSQFSLSKLVKQIILERVYTMKRE